MADLSVRPIPELLYLTSHQILVCSPCRSAVKPGAGVESHLRKVHRWTKDRLKEAVTWSSTLSLQDLHQVPLLSNSTAPLPGLTLLDGYRCQGCDFLTSNQKELQKHRRRA